MGQRLLPWKWLADAGILLSAATVTGFLGGWWWVFDLFAHFRVQCFVSLALVALVLLAGRRFRPALVFSGFAAANLAVILPFYVGGGADQAGPTTRAVLFNVNSNLGDPAQVADLLRGCDADIVVLEELSARWTTALRAVLKDYPHATLEAREDSFGIGLLTRLPVNKAETVYIGPAGVPSFIAELRANDALITVIATHALPPAGPRYARLRDEHLAEIPGLVEEAAGPVLLLGDLNATPWSHAFRRLLRRSGLRDSMRGHGVQNTWPTGNPLLRIPIDHCLHSDAVEIVDRERGPKAGSDHFPLIVDFRVHEASTSAKTDAAKGR